MLPDQEEPASPIATSSQNTGIASPPSPSKNEIYEKGDEGPTSITAAELADQLAEEKAERKKERFFWILPLTILSDCILWNFLGTGFGSVFIGLLSIVFLIGMANWLEVRWVLRHLEMIFSKFSKEKPPADEEPE